MASFLNPLIAFVSAHPELAYLTVFLAALLEAVPVVGSVIPGSTIIFALSGLIPGGELRLEWVLAAAAAGALLGDGSAFWIGHRAKGEILSSWPMSRYPQLVERSEAFFRRWGALAVFFARFVPPIRAFVPITAGALGMSPPLFYAVNIPAILLWAPAHVLPGVLAVSALHQYAGIPHHTGIGKHYWILAVIGGAADRRAGDLDDPPLAWRRRDQAGDKIHPQGSLIGHDFIKAGLRPGAGPIYRARGRISPPCRNCSQACAIHPTVRAMANSTSSLPGARPSVCTSTASA